MSTLVPKRSVEVSPQLAGQVSTVAPIDNGSVVIALLPGWLCLQEALTPAGLAGSGFTVLGLLVIGRG